MSGAEPLAAAAIAAELGAGAATAGTAAAGAGAAGAAAGAGAAGAGAMGAGAAGAGAGLLGGAEVGAAGAGAGGGLLGAGTAAAPAADAAVMGYGAGTGVGASGQMMAGGEAFTYGSGFGPGMLPDGALVGQQGGQMIFTTPSVFAQPEAGTMAYSAGNGVGASPMPAPSAWDSAMAQAKQYGGQMGKAASNYGTMNSAMGGGQQPGPQGPSRPVFQGQAPQIAQQQQEPQANQFARMLMEKRMRGGMMG